MQRRAIEKSAIAAGFDADHIKLISTAAAACISCFDGDNEEIPEKPILVVDFGFTASFTTCQISKTEEGKKVIKVLAHKDASKKEVNGDLLNQILLDIFKSEAKKKNETVPEDNQIILECEDNKKYLSDHENAYIGSIRIKRDTFDFKADDIITKFEDLMSDFFEKHGYEEGEDDGKIFGKVVLIGGEMNIPLFYNRVANVTGEEEDDIAVIAKEASNRVIRNLSSVGEVQIEEAWPTEDFTDNISAEEIKAKIDEIDEIYNPKVVEPEIPEDPEIVEMKLRTKPDCELYFNNLIRDIMDKHENVNYAISNMNAKQRKIVEELNKLLSQEGIPENEMEAKLNEAQSKLVNTALEALPRNTINYDLLAIYQ